MQVYVSKNEKQWGPYEASHIKSLIESGSFDLQDWAWVEGQTEWVPLARVHHLLLAEEAAKAAVNTRCPNQAQAFAQIVLMTTLMSACAVHPTPTL